jgi:putative ABC transport system substrate-binding protein
MRLIGLAVVLAVSLFAAPLAPKAQQVGNARVLGYLSLASPQSAAHATYRSAVVQGLRELGYVEGQQFAIECRFAGGQRDRLPHLAAELVRLKPDAIVGEGVEATLALKHETGTTPIVMVACDAVAAGLVAGLAKPGGNITGVTCITPELSGKRLQLLKDLTPNLTRVAVVWNPADPAKAFELKEMQGAAVTLGVKLVTYEVRRAEDFDEAFATMKREPGRSAMILGDSFTVLHRARIADLATRQGIATVYPFREFVEAGGLLAYGPNGVEMFRQLAPFVDKILKGAKPGDLPVEQPTKFELVINMKTAKALGLTIPQTLLQRADQVIE